MIDLESVLKQLIRAADPIHHYHHDGKLQHRLIVALTYSAAGTSSSVGSHHKLTRYPGQY
jgi:hypothetical protein